MQLSQLECITYSDTIQIQMIDVHSHILPGLDDGVRTLDESIQVLSGLKQLGFSTVVSTTHFYPGKYTPTAEAVATAFMALNGKVKELGLNLELIQGRECYFDYALTVHEERETFPFEYGGKLYQLIELPMSLFPMGLSSYVDSLSRKGVQPILAHVERYPYVIAQPKLVEDFIHMGMKIQVDCLSFQSSIKELQKLSWNLLEQGKIDLLASDVHRPSQIKPLELAIQKILEKTKLSSLEKFCSLSHT